MSLDGYLADGGEETCMNELSEKGEEEIPDEYANVG